MIFVKSTKKLAYSSCLKCVIRKYCNPAGVRVRFAPSPTGYLHLGGLRTALYNYLFAKSQNGTFILRIEDTDQSRLVQGAVTQLEDDLKWAGLDPDEGPSAGGLFGPYLQSERVELYKKEADLLLSKGKAYYCFCTDRRLNLLKKDALKRREIPKYDNHCRHLTADEVEKKLQETSYCVRFKLTALLEPFQDLIYGPILHNVAEVEGDPVILKSDGFPTYHFANVVDDHHMKITHVLRGVEWQPSTSKHLLLYKAFNWTPPAYAHLPLLLSEDGKKLSKRHNDATIEAFRKNGVYAIALINFMTLCGGGFMREESTEKIDSLKSMKELTEKFSLDLIRANNCQVPLGRIDEFNRIELKRIVSDEKTLNDAVEYCRNIVKQHFTQENRPVPVLDDERIKKILRWSVDRITRINDVVHPKFIFLWTEPSRESLAAFDRSLFESLPLLIKKLEDMKSLDALCSDFFKKCAEEKKLKHSELMHFLRVCLSGLKFGPSISELIANLGKETAVERLKKAYALYQSSQRSEIVS